MNSENEIFSVSVENTDLHFIIHEESFIQKFSERWEKALHTHVYYEILFSTSDNNRLILPDREITLVKNSFAVIPPYQMHTTSFEKDSFLISIGFYYEQNQRKYTRSDIFSILERSLTEIFESNEPDDGLRELFLQLRGFHLSDDFISEGFISASCIQILYTVLAIIQQKNRDSQKSDARTEQKKPYSPYRVSFNVLYQINNILNTEYTKDITPESLSRSFFISPRQINRYIMNQYGQTFLQRRNLLRISTARELLQETDKPISEISNTVGYSSINTFYSAFKLVTGVTPNLYRNSHRKKPE